MNSPEDFLEIRNQQAFISLLDSCECGRLPNSNLLVCENCAVSAWAVEFIAQKVLAVETLGNCVDFFQIRPEGSMLLISVDQIRDLRAKIYLSPKVGRKKFVAIFNADCMHTAAANAFLKTLEEPPDDTIIFLTTAKLHALPPTISGRCSITRLFSALKYQGNEEIRNWFGNYSAWLDSLFFSTCEEKNGALMRMYLLLWQLESLSNNLVEAMGKNDSTDGLGTKRQVCGMLFSQMAKVTSEFFEMHPDHLKFFPEIIANLEAKAGLVALNVNFMACVEVFLIEIFQMSARVAEGVRQNSAVQKFN
ncbi:MAG: hypothetical protein LBI56_00245 [Puniceicoccales bacterium]|jgi:DNA polymerase-3 subunit delta'|nr:hypothetical protein [Puniceicoccales bacterium]